jgi:hypothetical protein
MKKNIDQMIYSSLDEVLNELNLKNEFKKEASTEIYSGDGLLDSLGLVTFLVSLEQKINDAYKINITIASDKAMSMTNSPFSTIYSLSNYLQKLIEEK